MSKYLYSAIIIVIFATISLSLFYSKKSMDPTIFVLHYYDGKNIDVKDGVSNHYKEGTEIVYVKEGALDSIVKYAGGTLIYDKNHQIIVDFNADSIKKLIGEKPSRSYVMFFFRKKYLWSAINGDGRYLKPYLIYLDWNKYNNRVIGIKIGIKVLYYDVSTIKYFILLLVLFMILSLPYVKIKLERFFQWIMIVAFIVTLFMYMYLIFYAPIYIDEIEHFHSAYNVSHGLVHYKDFFEHHHPGLWFLILPIVRTSLPLYNKIIMIRFLSLLMFIFTLFFVFKVVSQLWSEKVGRWTLFLLFIIPVYFRNMWILRPDILYILLSFASIYLFITEKNVYKILISGLLMSVSYIVSLKSLLFLPFIVGYGLLYQKHKKDLLLYLSGYFVGILIFYVYIFWVDGVSLKNYLFLNIYLNKSTWMKYSFNTLISRWDGISAFYMSMFIIMVFLGINRILKYKKDYLFIIWFLYTIVSLIFVFRDYTCAQYLFPFVIFIVTLFVVLVYEYFSDKINLIMVLFVLYALITNLNTLSFMNFSYDYLIAINEVNNYKNEKVFDFYNIYSLETRDADYFNNMFYIKYFDYILLKPYKYDFLGKIARQKEVRVVPWEFYDILKGEKIWWTTFYGIKKREY